MRVERIRGGIEWIACAAAVLLAWILPSSARASCAAPVSCVCDHNVTADAVVRGVLTVMDHGPAQVEITHVLRDDSGDQLLVGDVIGGSFVPVLPCGGAALVQSGQEVLALWWRGKLDRYPYCVEYRLCTEERCNPLLRATQTTPEWDACDMGCITSTRDACLEHADENRLSGGFALLPWSDEIDLGAGQRLPAAEVDVLSDLWGCRARFSAPPVVCNDVIHIAVTPSSCAVVAPGTDRDPADATLGLAAGVVLLVGRRLRSRSRR